jgi:hypothetical protein
MEGVRVIVGTGGDKAKMAWSKTRAKEIKNRS